MMTNNPDDYPVYPEDDGTDRPLNPYSPFNITSVQLGRNHETTLHHIS